MVLSPSPPPLPSEPPPPPPPRKRGWFGLPPALGYLTGCALGFVALGVLAFGALGVALELGHVPDTAVVAGRALPGAAHRAIERHAGLEPGEEVLFYYSSGFLSHAEDGNVVTDRRAISWGRDGDGEWFLSDARWEDVERVDVVTEGSFLEDTVVDLVTADDGLVRLSLSAEGGGDERALAAIRERAAER